MSGDRRRGTGVWCMDSVSSALETHLGTTSSLSLFEVKLLQENTQVFNEASSTSSPHSRLLTHHRSDTNYNVDSVSHCQVGPLILRQGDVSETVVSKVKSTLKESTSS